MDVKDWLQKVGYLGQSAIIDDHGLIWYSNYDDSYIVRDDLLDDPDSILVFLAENNVAEELTHGVGFSPTNDEWFGWSHRAIAGFTIGSEVKKGDCAYNPANKEDFIENALEFWDDKYHEKIWISETTDIYFVISWIYNDEVPNESLRGKVGSINIDFPKNYGKGEWVAKTMKDAKQMAKDFNEGVS